MVAWRWHLEERWVARSTPRQTGLPPLRTSFYSSPWWVEMNAKSRRCREAQPCEVTLKQPCEATLKALDMRGNSLSLENCCCSHRLRTEERDVHGVSTPSSRAQNIAAFPLCVCKSMAPCCCVLFSCRIRWTSTQSRARAFGVRVICRCPR